VGEVWLLDSLYGNTDDFDGWVQANADWFTGTPATMRFASVYTGTAGTLGNSQAMAGRAKGWLDAANIVDDRTTATLTPAQFEHGLVFKRTGLSHDGVPRYYFGKLALTSSLPDKP
jgi:hypothetical protein